MRWPDGVFASRTPSPDPADTDAATAAAAGNCDVHSTFSSCPPTHDGRLRATGALDHTSSRPPLLADGTKLGDIALSRPQAGGGESLRTDSPSVQTLVPQLTVSSSEEEAEGVSHDGNMLTDFGETKTAAFPRFVTRGVGAEKLTTIGAVGGGGPGGRGGTNALFVK